MNDQTPQTQQGQSFAQRRPFLTALAALLVGMFAPQFSPIVGSLTTIPLRVNLESQESYQRRCLPQQPPLQPLPVTPTTPPAATPPTTTPPTATPPAATPPTAPQPPVIIIQPPAPAPAPAPATPAPTKPKTTVQSAIGRIQFGRAGCTATVIAPRRPDGRYWVLTASHCTEAWPFTGNMTMRDGKTVGVQYVAADRVADCCWLVTREDVGELPAARLAEHEPSYGEVVWHAGFGVDRPGNVERGRVTMPDTGFGKTQFALSVSSGDSGGGIILDKSGEVVSCVCCTARTGATAPMYGASVSRIRALWASVQGSDATDVAFYR